MRPIRSMDDYRELYQLSLDAPETFWAEQAECVTWFHPFAQRARTSTSTRSTSPGSSAAA